MKKLITISSVLLGVVFLSGCSSQQTSQTQSSPQPSQASEQAKTQNEEARLKTLAGTGELIKMSDQDKKDIVDWVAKYKESKNTAFEKVDIDWNYDDPAGVWFAQKQLEFNTVTKPPADLDKIRKDLIAKNGYVSNGGYHDSLNLFKKVTIPDKLFPMTLDKAKQLYTLHIPILNEYLNIVNQYYPSRVPSSELLMPNQTSDIFDSKMNDAAGIALNKASSMFPGDLGGGGWGSLSGGETTGVLNRINAIASAGEPNTVYEFVPLTKEGENTSYFSDIKNVEGNGSMWGPNKTLIAGQVRVKATTYEKVDTNYVRKSVRYIDFLNIDGSSSYPYPNFTQSGPELLSYNGFLTIDYKQSN